jgi:hypothetical protein
VFPGDTVIVEAVAAANVNRALDNQPLASMMYLSAVMNLMGGVSWLVPLAFPALMTWWQFHLIFFFVTCALETMLECLSLAIIFSLV